MLPFNALHSFSSFFDEINYPAGMGISTMRSEGGDRKELRGVAIGAGVADGTVKG